MSDVADLRALQEERAIESEIERLTAENVRLTQQFRAANIYINVLHERIRALREKDS